MSFLYSLLTGISLGEGLVFKPENFANMLGYMGKGMLVIFVIIGVIIFATVAINKMFSKK